ncbi:hypothetical protein E2562_003656 [Oryza meyeriana var. granulata]|uniref:Uncharacterized protein n=1 Tax=Oryza meyeriana var. granulata TaxID=110450 RepID=A0A6G1C3M8_9ORYZ|nr:hypothetical protein E2562_003656 [Oryza meyeriana var. granulata]
MWPRPCRRVLATIPELEYKLDGREFATLIPHVIANWTAEAKALADPLLSAAVKKGGELPRCLVACAASLDDVSKVMSRLPAQIDGERYPKVQSFLRGLFKSGAVPPLCKSSCPDKSCSVEEKTIADKFHAIWALMDSVEPYTDYFSPPSLPPTQSQKKATNKNIIIQEQKHNSVMVPRLFFLAPELRDDQIVKVQPSPLTLHQLNGWSG